MASYFNFISCKEKLGSLMDSIKQKNKNIIKEVTDSAIVNFTKKLWNFKSMSDVDTYKFINEVISMLILDNNKLKKIKINLYSNTEKSDEQDTDTLKTKIPAKLVSIMSNSKYNNDTYIQYYKNNPNANLTNIHLLLLTAKIKPIHFYLDNTLNEAYGTIFKLASLLDSFIEIDGVPGFFEEYAIKIGLTGLQLIDIEIILGLLTNLLLIDTIDELKNKYNDKGQIIELNNIFDLLFKWKYIDTSALTISTKIAKSSGQLNMTSYFKSILDGIDAKYHAECMKLYDSGKMSISVYIAYFIKSLKSQIPVLSFSRLGYIDDLCDLVINNAKTQHGGVDIITVMGTLSFLKDIGIFSIVAMIGSLSKKLILSCLRTLYKDNKIDISKNYTFAQLADIYKNDDDTMFINLITQNKYSYLSNLILTCSFNKDITIADKMLISDICKKPSALKNMKKADKPLTNTKGNKLNQLKQRIAILEKKNRPYTETDFKFDSLSYAYDVALPLLKMPSIVETGVLGIDMLYILFSEKKAIFKIYDKFISTFYQCDDYTIEQEFEYLSKLIISFMMSLSKTSVIIIRKKIISFILIQNLYLLHRKYYISKGAENKPEHIAMLVDICNEISKVVDKHDMDELNELILACLGMPNKLFKPSKTELLSILVNYNFIAYREYVALMELVTLQKALLFEKLHNKSEPEQNNPVESVILGSEPDVIQEPEKIEQPVSTSSTIKKFLSGLIWGQKDINQTMDTMTTEIENKTEKEIDIEVTEAVKTTHDSLAYININESISMNKQKVELFFQKLFEYNLYISFPIIENKLNFSIVNNIMHSVEIDTILNHLKNQDTHLLFETDKQKSKIRFLGYY